MGQRVRDGGPADEDAKPNGRVDAAIDQLAPIAGAPEAPTRVVKDDWLFAVDPVAMDLVIRTFGVSVDHRLRPAICEPPGNFHIQILHRFQNNAATRTVQYRRTSARTETSPRLVAAFELVLGSGASDCRLPFWSGPIGPS
ncbi:MAG: hypothetical protein ACRDH5_10235, partial [bacterium]